MNIYFSCSLTGGRDDEEVYGVIVDHLLAAGHEVPTAHLARPEVMLEERIVDPFEVYDRDIAWIDGCDVLIAEVSVAWVRSAVLSTNPSRFMRMKTNSMFSN